MVSCTCPVKCCVAVISAVAQLTLTFLITLFMLSYTYSFSVASIRILFGDSQLQFQLCFLVRSLTFF